MNNVERPMFLMIIIFVFMFICLRILLVEIESVNLRKKEIKSRKQGQSLWEWFTFSRYRDVVPKFIVPIYYITLLINAMGLFIIGFQQALQGDDEIIAITLRGVQVFDLCWWIVLWLASFDPKYPHLRMELWVPNIKTGKTAGRYKNQKSSSGRHR